MLNEDLKKVIIQTLKDHLRLEINVGAEYGYRGDVVRIKLILIKDFEKDEVISEERFSLPENK